MEVSVDEQGRMVIPPTLERLLGLSPGMTLVAEEDSEGQICLRIHPEAAMMVDKEGVLVVRAQPLGALDEVTRSERDRRARELLKRVSQLGPRGLAPRSSPAPLGGAT